jgi:hypothetical protein
MAKASAQKGKTGVAPKTSANEKTDKSGMKKLPPKLPKAQAQAK